MIVQDVIALRTFNSHGGPITHSSTGSKPDSHVHPLFPRLFLTRGLVCNSRTTVLLIYSGIRRNTYSRCLNPFHTLFQASNDCLPARNFSWYLLTLLSILSQVFIRELLSATFPDVIDQIVNLIEVRSLGVPPFILS